MPRADGLGLLHRAESEHELAWTRASQMHAARLMTLHAARLMDAQGASAARREISLIEILEAVTSDD